MTRARSFAAIAIVLGLGLAVTAHGMDSADLSVSSTATPNPVTVGNPLSYSIQVLNQGPAAATDVVLRVSLFPGTTVTAVTASQGTCTGATLTVTCTLGTLPVGAAASVRIDVTTYTLGVIESTAIAEATPAGARPAEQVARIRTSVLAPPDVQLSVTNVGSGTGTVNSSPPGLACRTSCIATYPFGTTVILTAAGLDGAAFSGWTGDCGGVGTCTVTLMRAGQVTARFDPPASFPLAITLAGTGAGTVNAFPQSLTCQQGQVCVLTYPPGTLVSLTAAPQAGSVFAGWSGPACTGTSTCTLTLNESLRVTATFSLSTTPVRLPVPVLRTTP